MPQRVMRSIATPAQMFWAPVELALLNFLIAGFVMMMGFVFEVNPLWSLTLLVINHLILASIGAKEPHAYTILMCFSRYNKPTKNLIKIKGRKFVP